MTNLKPLQPMTKYSLRTPRRHLLSCLAFTLAFSGTGLAQPVPPKEEAGCIEVIGSLCPAANTVPEVCGPEVWKNPAKPVEARVRDLVSRMTLAEKTSQLRADAAALPRLGIPAYSYRNECLHGVQGNEGTATVFPAPIGMAATWNLRLMQQVGDAIATEARAKFNDYTSRHNGESVFHSGISFYSTNINIVRDPRWGRAQETYGEDPFLTARFGVAHIRGLQGSDPQYVKAMACAKHFAVHSGPEPERMSINFNPPERDFYETYIPAFEAAVLDGKVGSVMGAYSSLYGTPDCENPFLLTYILKKKWNFNGFIVSDGGAISGNWRRHKYEATPEEACANAVKAGCDLFSSSLGGDLNGKKISDAAALGLMLKKQLLSENEIDAAVTASLTARFRLGLFDPPSMVMYSKIGLNQNNTPEHRALTLKVAEESMVLLKNDGILPLDRKKVKRIAVIGANADAKTMLLGNYINATGSAHTITILEGIKQVAGPEVSVSHATGSPLAIKNDNSNKPTPEMTAEAVSLAKAADVIIYVGGLDSTLECESAKVPFQGGFRDGDRTKIELPPPQEELLKALHATGKPVIYVNCSGAAIAMPWAAKHLPAILQAWYSGEQGGLAVAKVLFGETNPAGRLPVTFYASTDDLHKDFTDYSMSGRTYRYFDGNPLYAFGHGLSYTEFDYIDAKLDSDTVHADKTIKVSVNIKNSGGRDGDEVVQVYYRHIDSPVPQAKMTLCGFSRVPVKSGDRIEAKIEIPAKELRYWDVTSKQYVVDPGRYELLVGGASDDIRLRIPVVITAPKKLEGTQSVVELIIDPKAPKKNIADDFSGLSFEMSTLSETNKNYPKQGNKYFFDSRNTQFITLLEPVMHLYEV